METESVSLTWDSRDLITTVAEGLIHEDEYVRASAAKAYKRHKNGKKRLTIKDYYYLSNILKEPYDKN